MSVQTVPASHPGFARAFAPGRLTLGFMFPMGPSPDGIPDMADQLALAQRADEIGFAALWSRDVPLFDPDFGDAGQVYDPWVWLGQVAANTKRIALATGGIVLPLRHPLHVAKAATSVDQLSGGRFILGAASGDRASEYPAFARSHETRGDAFRDSVKVIRRVTAESFPKIESGFGKMQGLDLLPKPAFGRLPFLAVGSARQTVQWIAENTDGWVTYPRDIEAQQRRIDLWKMALDQRAPGLLKPFVQSLFIDLTEDPDEAPTPIFLGFRLGRNRLIEHLEALKGLGVHHVFFNLRHGHRPAAEVLEELGAEVLPQFPALPTPNVPAAQRRVIPKQQAQPALAS